MTIKKKIEIEIGDKKYKTKAITDLKKSRPHRSSDKYKVKYQNKDWWIPIHLVYPFKKIMAQDWLKKDTQAVWQFIFMVDGNRLSILLCLLSAVSIDCFESL